MSAIHPEPRPHVPPTAGITIDSILDAPVTISRFDTAFPKGPAFGLEEQTTWGALTQLLRRRREGKKDGANIIPATFRPEPDGRVRRLACNLVSRTAVILDIETNTETGEVPPHFADAVELIEGQNWAAGIYTSHSHIETAPRYRIVLPLSEQIDFALPAVEIVAERLHLTGVLDKSKVGAASLFYLPSCGAGEAGRHAVEILDGEPLDAAWIRDRASKLFADQEAERARQREQAKETAARKRAEKERRGFDPDAMIIEAIRDRLDLKDELRNHGYTESGKRFLYPESRTGVPGVFILNGDGIERVYSHHSEDPLAAGNLPSWCTVKAVDVVDVVTILDFGSNRNHALKTLADQFGLNQEKAERQSRNEQQQDEQPEPEPQETGKAKPGRGPKWPHPVDFLSDHDQAPPVLEERHLPPALVGFVQDTAERMGADPACIALGCLVACASVVTDDWKVKPKRFDDTWLESPRLWGAIVGAASIMKTPIITICTKPIDKLEAEARRIHADAMQVYKQKLQEVKADESVPEPEYPRLDRYLIEGATVEAISEVLREDEDAKLQAPARKVLSRWDEMSEFSPA